MAGIAPVKECQAWEATMTEYHVCDHPRLLVQDGVCFLCYQFDGQTDALTQLKES